MTVAFSDSHPTLYVVSPRWNRLGSVLFGHRRIGLALQWTKYRVDECLRMLLSSCLRKRTSEERADNFRVPLFQTLFWRRLENGESAEIAQRKKRGTREEEVTETHSLLVLGRFHSWVMIVFKRINSLLIKEWIPEVSLTVQRGSVFKGLWNLRLELPVAPRRPISQP